MPPHGSGPRSVPSTRSEKGSIDWQFLGLRGLSMDPRSTHAKRVELLLAHRGSCTRTRGQARMTYLPQTTSKSGAVSPNDNHQPRASSHVGCMDLLRVVTVGCLAMATHLPAHPQPPAIVYHSPGANEPGSSRGPQRSSYPAAHRHPL